MVRRTELFVIVPDVSHRSASLCRSSDFGQPTRPLKIADLHPKRPRNGVSAGVVGLDLSAQDGTADRINVDAALASQSLNGPSHDVHGVADIHF